MNKIFKYLILIVSISFAKPSQAQQLSPEAEIRVMTLGPYQGELYSAFGHSAFRVYDPARGINIVYNYGVFDFDQENFYLNFVRGKMLYKLGTSRYERFVKHYVDENRFVYEQVLNLTQEEKQKLMDFLVNNKKPENRDYYYNYVYDNCATKIGDVLQEVLGKKLVLDTSFKEDGLTFRGLMDRYLDHQYWGDFGIDLGLGAGVDKEAAGEEYLFLPDYVYRSFMNSKITDENGNRPLVAETDIIFEATPEVQEKPMLTPFNVLTILFFVIGFLTNIDFKKNRRSKWIDYLFFGLAGLIGWFLLFLWFGTDHISAWNYNLLWALPTHLIVVFFLRKRDKYRKQLKAYFKWTSIFYVLLIVIWSFLPQPLHSSLIPLILILTLRGFYLVHDLRR
ncbi:MAG: DUF4105 domain-containing protein [Cyclobacteriaceae bacterium]